MDNSYPTTISKNDDANSITNPIFTQDVAAQVTPEVITPVHDFSPASVAGNGTENNHDYAVAGTVFRLKSVIIASTGKVKFSVKVGPVGTLAEKAVSFSNATENSPPALVFNPPIIVAAGEVVRVVRKQNQTGSNEVYSTIIGEDVA